MAKRLLDIAGPLVVLVVLGPLLVVVAALVRLRMGRPAIFRQERAGRGGKPFTIYKFRTMTDVTDSAGNLRPDQGRLTRVGTALRASSLDELPEFWNVLKGDMSLVGPRPLPLHYLPRYTNRERRRHEVRPGVTGWAQVNGRNTTSWEDRLEMDVWYVENRTLWLDLRILVRTLGAVVARRGIGAEGHATMDELRPELSSE